MARDAADDLRRWSGPINNLDEGERLSLFDSMLPNGRPRIEITDALRNNWFEIWYQPKIDLKRKCLAGAEALARIRHPAFGVLLPGSFLPFASEEATLQLAEHALLSTLRTWSTFDAAGFNLHRHQCSGERAAQAAIRRWCARTAQADHWPGIILEVTEDQIVRDIKQAHDIAMQLRRRQLSPFRSMISAPAIPSFSSLRNLSFAEIKIDSVS